MDVRWLRRCCCVCASAIIDWRSAAPLPRCLCCQTIVLLRCRLDSGCSRGEGMTAGKQRVALFLHSPRCLLSLVAILCAARFDSIREGPRKTDPADVSTEIPSWFRRSLMDPWSCSSCMSGWPWVWICVCGVGLCTHPADRMSVESAPSHDDGSTHATPLSDCALSLRHDPVRSAAAATPTATCPLTHPHRRGQQRQPLPLPSQLQQLK